MFNFESKESFSSNDPEITKKQIKQKQTDEKRILFLE